MTDAAIAECVKSKFSKLGYFPGAFGANNISKGDAAIIGDWRHRTELLLAPVREAGMTIDWLPLGVRGWQKKWMRISGG